MKYNTKIIGLTLALLLATTGANAAGTIATLNVPEIMQKSTAAQSIREQLDNKVKAFQAEMTKKEEQLNSEEQDIRKQKGVLSPDALDKKIKAFKTKAAAAQKDVQSKRAELDGASSDSLGQIQKAVYDIVSVMAKEKGYTVVVTQAFWADPALDITADVLTKLNSTLPKVTVTFKDPKAKEGDK